MRIAIVNDMKMAAEVLRRVIATSPNYQLAWIAADGKEAVERCKTDRPDLILMDLIMPVMDGVESTRRIMKECPCPILVVTARISNAIGKVYDAMGAGALDAVNTPVLNRDGVVSGGLHLLEKIAVIGRLIGDCRHDPIATPIPPPNTGSKLPKLILIGSSTGGPQALSNVLAGLPKGINLAVIIAQHVDMDFAPGLVDWLASRSPMPVSAAVAGEPPKAGHVNIAVSPDHLVIACDLTLIYTPNPRECPYRPSVDALFRSAATYWPDPGEAILLTGMGRDGAQGMLQLRKRKWHTIAQAEDDCVVYGMPKAAAELDAAVEVLPSNRIAASILSRVAYKGVDPI